MEAQINVHGDRLLEFEDLLRLSQDENKDRREEVEGLQKKVKALEEQVELLSARVRSQEDLYSGFIPRQDLLLRELRSMQTNKQAFEEIFASFRKEVRDKLQAHEDEWEHLKADLAHQRSSYLEVSSWSLNPMYS